MIEYFIKNLVFFALTAISALVFKFILSKAKFKSANESNILKYPLLYRLAPLTFVGYFLIVSGLAIWQGDWLYMIIAAVVALGGLLTMLLWSIWRVEIGENGFVYTSCLGKKRAFNYEDLEIRRNERGTKWYFYKGEEQVFCMPFFITNGYKLEKSYERYMKKR